MTDPNQIRTDYVSDGYGRAIKTVVNSNNAGTNPTPQTSYTSYDGFGRLSNVTNPQGIVSYGYDLLNRRSLDFGTDSSSLNHVGYQYDGLSRISNLSNNFLRDQSSQHYSQSLGYSYAADRLLNLTYPNGTRATFAYDGANRLTSVAHLLPPALASLRAITVTTNWATSPGLMTASPLLGSCPNTAILSIIMTN